MKKKNRVFMTMVLISAMIMTMIPFYSFADARDCSGSAEKNDISAVDHKGAEKTLDAAAGVQPDISAPPITLNKKSYELDDEVGDFIRWNGSADATLFRGQKLYIDFTMWDTYKNYYTIPRISIFRSDDIAAGPVYDHAPLDSDLVVSVDSYDDFDGYFDIDSKHLATGEYSIFIFAMPCYSSGLWVSDLSDFTIPTEILFFNVKDLAKPGSLKLTAGKKKVKVSFKKVSGANKYEIYRSTKKSKGYKKIKTVSKNTYTDKKVKKGKRYYYKVRAKAGNSKTLVVSSAFTSPKRSSKVK